MRKEESTKTLEEALLNPDNRHNVQSDISVFLEEYKSSFLSQLTPFHTYFKETLKENAKYGKKIAMKDIFIQADISMGYGYKLVSGDKTTRKRDVILRLLYAAEFTLEQTQKALKIYGLPQLYVKIPRDAVIMICFNERPGDIYDVNNILEGERLKALEKSGEISDED